MRGWGNIGDFMFGKGDMDDWGVVRVYRVKIMEKFPYTERELVERGIGKTIQPRDNGWTQKSEVYHLCGVWEVFSKLRASYRERCTSSANWVDNNLMNIMAQNEVDKYLKLKCRGEEVSAPVPLDDVLTLRVKLEEAQKRIAEMEGGGGDSGLVSLSDFGDAACAGIDPVRDINWIYNNLAVKGIMPADAPSPGAYAHLRYIQANEKAMEAFFNSVYPRMIPAKSQIEDVTKRNDDGRRHFELLDRLQAECLEGQE